MKHFPARFLVLLLPLALILPFAGQFPYPAYSVYSDMAISHFPNAIFLRETILRDHQIPLWSPLILSGYPFAANPLSGLWYPPGWLALLFPLPLGFNLLVMAHWLLGGYGMVRFLRAMDLDIWPSLSGAFIFELLPRSIAHYASGHLTLSYAIPWTPWLLLVALRSFSAPRGFRFFREAVILALIGLADLRWLAFSGLLWACYQIYLVVKSRAAWWKWLPRCLAQAGVAALLCAPVLLPLLEYTRLSTRSAMESADNLFLSLPPARLFSLASPSLDGNTEWTVYAGGAALALTIWALGNRQIRRMAGFWLGVAFVSLLLSLGGAIPGLSAVFRLPGFDLLRVPSRFVLLAGFGLAVVAAVTVQYMLADDRAGEKSAFWSRLLSAGIAGFTALAAFGTWFISGRAPINFLWGFAAVGLTVGLLFLRDRGSISGRVWTGMLFLVCAVDLLGAGAVSLHYRPTGEVLAEGGELAEVLDRQVEPFRVFSSSYSLPQQTAAVYGLEMANGIDPLQLSAYADFLVGTSGVPARGYSVVLPPVQSGDIGYGNARYTPNARLLGLLNVRYLASETPLDAPGLVSAGLIGSTYLYRNSLAMPRAWVQPEDAVVGQSALAVEDLTLTPDRIDLVASGPGKLVLSETNYPGWTAEIDSRAVKVETFGGLFRAVTLPAGRHAVRFSFRPVPVFTGLAAAGLGLLVIVLAGWHERRNPR